MATSSSIFGKQPLARRPSSPQPMLLEPLEARALLSAPSLPINEVKAGESVPSVGIAAGDFELTQISFNLALSASTEDPPQDVVTILGHSEGFASGIELRFKLEIENPLGLSVDEALVFIQFTVAPETAQGVVGAVKVHWSSDSSPIERDELTGNSADERIRQNGLILAALTQLARWREDSGLDPMTVQPLKPQWSRGGTPSRPNSEEPRADDRSMVMRPIRGLENGEAAAAPIGVRCNETSVRPRSSLYRQNRDDSIEFQLDRELSLELLGIPADVTRPQWCEARICRAAPTESGRDRACSSRFAASDFSSSSLPLDQQNVGATVSTVAGRAASKADRSDSWNPVAPGQVLRRGDQLRLSVRSSVVLHSKSGRRILLSSLGVYSVAEILDGKATVISNKYAQLIFPIETAGRIHDAKVRSPSSVLAVRG